jgi:carboxypeptidase Q
MTKALLAALLAAAAAPALSQPAIPTPPPPPVPAQIERLRDAALNDDFAWDVVEGLTTEVGPRLAGTEAEARARDWSVRKLRALGFANVRVESFDMPVWVRGEETAWVTAPVPQPLVVSALGNSGATPHEGIEA